MTGFSNGDMTDDWRKGLHRKAVEAVEQALAPNELVHLTIHGVSNQAIVRHRPRPSSSRGASWRARRSGPS